MTAGRDGMRTAARPARMAADERRELVLAAATRSFARTGFAGTSTDAVAREAEVSQPYVVKIFGTKQDLFLSTCERAASRVCESFAAVVRDAQFDPSREADRLRLEGVYADLLRDSDLVLVLLHGFAAGDNPVFRARAQGCMGSVYRLLLEAGMSATETRDLIARGALLTLLVALRVPEDESCSEDLRDLLARVFAHEDSTTSGRASASPESHASESHGHRQRRN